MNTYKATYPCGDKLPVGNLPAIGKVFKSSKQDQRAWSNLHYNLLVLKDVKQDYFVTIVLEDRAFGGREEGGWYYNTQEPVNSPYDAQFRSSEAAEIYAQALGIIVEHMNRGRRPISSVLSAGRYAIAITFGQPADYSPKYRPQYS